MNSDTSKLELKKTLLLVIVACGVLGALWFVPLGDIGIVDFSQYWSAGQLVSRGENPYDATLMRQVQHGELNLTTLSLLWLTPIVLPLAWVFSSIPFFAALKFWVVLSAIFYLLAGYLALRSAEVRRRFSGRDIFFLSTFPPFLQALGWGQISPLFAPAWCGAVYLLSNATSAPSRAYLSGLLVSLTFVKPQLFLGALVGIVTALPFKISVRVVLGSIFGAALLLSLATVVAPEGIHNYLIAISEPPLYWRNTTLGSWMQGFVQMLGVTDTGLLFAFRMLPLVIGSGVIVLVALKARAYIGTPLGLAVLGTTSVLISPYAWIYDYVAILGIFFALKTQLFRDVLIGFNLLALLTSGGLGMQYFIWYPLIAICLGVVDLWLNKLQDPQAGESLKRYFV